MKLLRKIRGAIGLGLLGASGGFTGALLLGAARRLVGLAPWNWADLVGLAQGGALLGAACGVGVAAVLTTLESNKSLRELSPTRVGLFGAVVGGLIPIAFMFATSGTFHFIHAPDIVATMLAIGGAVGGAIGGTAVTMAQRGLPSASASAPLLQSGALDE